MPSRAKNALASLALAVLPITIFVIAIRSFPPRICVYDFGDPDFGYLLNSLLIAIGHSPFHIDHPGTTLQLLGALLIRVRHAVSLISGATTPLPEALLLDPYSYLKFIQPFLVTALAAATFWAGKITFRYGRSLPAALCVQLIPWISFDTWFYLNRFSAEMPVVIMSLVLAGYLSRIEAVHDRKAPFALGIILGSGLATKFVFLPMLILAFLLPTSGEILVCLSSALATFLLVTAPIWPHYSRLLFWLEQLLTHQERYGMGKNGILPTASQVLVNFRELFVPGFGLCVLALAVAAVWIAALVLGKKSIHTESRLRSFGMVYFLAILAQFTVVQRKMAHRLLPDRPRVAALAALLASLSPFSILLGSGYLSHTSAAAGAAFTVWAALRARDGAPGWAVLAGLATGGMVASRPWTGIAVEIGRAHV